MSEQKQRMKGRIITREQLRAEGWEQVLLFGFSLFVFKKDEKRRIRWDSNTMMVLGKEYEYIDQKTSPPANSSK